MMLLEKITAILIGFVGMATFDYLFKTLLDKSLDLKEILKKRNSLIRLYIAVFIGSISLIFLKFYSADYFGVSVWSAITISIYMLFTRVLAISDD